MSINYFGHEGFNVIVLFCFVFQKFNDYLDGLSEHYDIPKVSWTK